MTYAGQLRLGVSNVVGDPSLEIAHLANSRHEVLGECTALLKQLVCRVLDLDDYVLVIGSSNDEVSNEVVAELMFSSQLGHERIEQDGMLDEEPMQLLLSFGALL